MHKSLTATGAGLIGFSLLVVLFLSVVDPLWAGQHLTLISVFGWAQQAALVLGAALFAAGQVVSRLAPPAKKSSPSEPSEDWFA